MSTFNFTLPGGQAFTLKGPEGMTFEQAQAIFKQQSDTGSLAGFNVGDVVSAATQAAEGLTAAAPQLSQGLASASGLLPKNIDTSSISAALGPGGSAVNGQISSALTGTGPAVASITTGASAGINAAVSGIGPTLSAGFAAFKNVLPGAIATTQANLPGELAKSQAALPGALAQISGSLGSINSLATGAIRSLSTTLSGTPTQGIDVSNLAKQTPSLGGIGNLSSGDVTATLAQASKLVGQSAAELSNTGGLGKFGFDASQLERAGLIKPGTAAQFLNQGANQLSDVLKSPTVWTGKDGIKGVDNLLGNENLQSKIQQDLMSSGLNDLRQIGIPTDKLTPQALSGLATNAAKSVEDAAKWATGGAGLTPGIKAGFDSVASNSAFAVNLSQGTAEESVLKERIVEPSVNTVNSATVDAAAARIVGNDKVPDVASNNTSGSAEIAVTSYVDFLNETNAALDALTQNSLSYLSQQPQISQSQWNTVNQEYQTIRATFNARNTDLVNAATSAVNSLDSADPNYARLVNVYNGFSKLFDLVKKQSETVKQIIANLANKITT